MEFLFYVLNVLFLFSWWSKCLYVCSYSVMWVFVSIIRMLICWLRSSVVIVSMLVVFFDWIEFIIILVMIVCLGLCEEWLVVGNEMGCSVWLMIYWVLFLIIVCVFFGSVWIVLLYWVYYEFVIIIVWLVLFVVIELLIGLIVFMVFCI